MATKLTKVTFPDTNYIDISDKLDKITGDGISSATGGGQSWYYRLATLQVTSTYANHPIIFEISGRGQNFTWLEVMFQNVNSKDPGLSHFTTNGENRDYWIKKTDTSTWEIYGKFSEKWGGITCHRVMGQGVTQFVTINMNSGAIDSDPTSGATQVTYGWISNAQMVQATPPLYPKKWQFCTGYVNNTWCKLFSGNYNSYNNLNMLLALYSGYNAYFLCDLFIRFTPSGIAPDTCYMLCYNRARTTNYIRVTFDDTNTFSVWLYTNGPTSRVGYEILSIANEAAVFYDNITGEFKSARWSFPTTFDSSSTAPTNDIPTSCVHYLAQETDINTRVAKTGDTMTGDLTLYKEGTTTNNYPTSLIFKNKDTTTGKTSTGYINAYDGGENGANLVIHPAGNIFIGSGESANAHYNLYKHSTAEMFFATADQHMYLQANGQTIANRRGLIINASHELLPCAADVATNKIGSIGNATYKWGSMYTTRFNQIITGTGTAGQDKGSGQSPRYFPSTWKFDTGIAVAAGDTFTIKIPVAGISYGVWISVDNGTNYYPVVTQGTTKLSTHFPVDNTITVIYEASATLDVMPTTGGNGYTSYTGGVFRVLNFYDSNTNTQMRVYRQNSGYNNDYPLLASRSLASAIGTAGSNSSYSAIYGVMWDDTTKIPTLNPSTGEIKTRQLLVNGGDLTVQTDNADGIILYDSNRTKMVSIGPDGSFSCSSTWDGTNVGLKTALANKLSLSGGTLTGWLAFAGSDINLKTTGASSNDSSDIAWWYGNGNEKARIWTDNTYTTKKGLNYRVYKEDGTALYSGRLATLDDVQNYTIATGDTDGTIKVTPTDGTAYEVAVKGFHAPNPMRQFYTTINTGSNFNISTKNARRGYVFIMFNKKTSPDSSNRAIAILPIIQTVMYVPFVVNTSFKSARFEITAESGTNNLLVKFLSISDTNFNIEGVYG